MKLTSIVVKDCPNEFKNVKYVLQLLKHRNLSLLACSFDPLQMLQLKNHKNNQRLKTIYMHQLLLISFLVLVL